MTVERGVELSGRILEIGKQIAFESEVASAAHDLNKLRYLTQEAIVLKKIAEVIACITLANSQNNEEI